VGVGSGTNDISNTTEVVGEGPEDFGGSGVGEEFILGLGRPEIMVRNGAVIDLDSCLVVFGNEDGFVGTIDFANPNVVVVVGVFDGLSGCPRFGFRVISLLGNFRQAVAVVPRVQFTVGGVGFGNTVAFVVIRVSPVRIRRQLVIRASRVLVAVGSDTVAVGVVSVRFVGNFRVRVICGD